MASFLCQIWPKKVVNFTKFDFKSPDCITASILDVRFLLEAPEPSATLVILELKFDLKFGTKNRPF